MTHYVYVGTYTQTGDETAHRKEGIYVFRRSAEDGRLTFVSKEAANENPSFVRAHPGKQFLYAVNEGVEGAISSFRVDRQTGALTFINQQPTLGVHPCYISFDPQGGFLFVANYSSGSLAVFPIRADGGLEPLSDLVVNVGSGPNLTRQERAHAHSVAFDPSGRFVLVADLGLDRILVYRLDREQGKLVLHELSGAAAAPGSGPRHFVFSPDGKTLYCANELNGTVTVCSWDAEGGILVPIQVVPGLPESYKGINDAADIHIEPSGTRLYLSNRGHNSIAVFVVSPDGRLNPVGHAACGGNWPRNFGVDPAGKWLYVANQRSGDLVTFGIGADGNLPAPTGEVHSLPSPVCVELVEL